jgi:hypothetical protein
MHSVVFLDGLFNLPLAGKRKMQDGEPGNIVPWSVRIGR